MFSLPAADVDIEVYQFVCNRNVVYDAGKEDYLRPSEHIGLDWIGYIVLIECFGESLNKVVQRGQTD